MVNRILPHVGSAALVFVIGSSMLPLLSCEKSENKAEAPRLAKSTPEQMEQQRVEEAKKVVAADRQLAAESAVKSLLCRLGEVKSVSFEPFKDSGQDGHGNQGLDIRSRFAAEVEASDDLVITNQTLQWQEPEDINQTRQVQVLKVVAPKGTNLLVTGTVNGKAVAGHHTFWAQQQEVNPAAGVVLPPRDNISGFDPRQALNQAQLRSLLKEGVLDGSPEHQKIKADLEQRAKDRRDAERRKQSERQELEIAEVVSVMSKLAASSDHLVVADDQGAGKTPWLFSRSFSNLRIDAATGDGTGTMTDWRNFPPTTTKLTIRKLARKDDRFGEEQNVLFLAIEPDDPGFAFLFDVADGAVIDGRRVRSLTDEAHSGDHVSLAAAGAAVSAEMAKWQAVASKDARPEIGSAKVLDKAALQSVMQQRPFVDGEFVAARFSEERNARLEVFREERRGGGYELFGNSTLLLRSAEGVAVRSVLFQLTEGAIAQPVLIINGSIVRGFAASRTEGGVLVEFSKPTTIYEMRFGSDSNSGTRYAVAAKLGLANAAGDGTNPN